MTAEMIDALRTALLTRSSCDKNTSAEQMMNATTKASSEDQPCIEPKAAIGVSASSDEKTFRQQQLATDLIRWDDMLFSFGIDPTSSISKEIGRLLLCSYVDHRNDPELVVDKGGIVVETLLAYLNQVERVIKMLDDRNRKRLMSQLNLMSGELRGLLDEYCTTGDLSPSAGTENGTNRGTS